MLSQLNSALAGRYLVEREIGQGGMATVYLARDLRHDRSVALKVLNPELAAVVGKERFLAEIRVTASLQHPHLLPLFDSGEADGQLFYVMPYVQGESLRGRLTREKQLSIDESIRIAISVGGALAYAHRHGVIHRDLKPENILLQEGQPLVADFGIALAVTVAGGARITQTGLSLGTPQYMSPEQATGDRAIDGRTDIYSLGAVLYEMLTGDPPHTGSTAQAIIAKVITDKPRPIRLARDTVPPHVEAAVECALAKLPADRFATAQDFIDALRGTRPVALPSGVMTPASIRTDPAMRAARRRRRILAGALLASGIAIGIVAAKLSEREPAPPRVSRFVIPDNDSARFRDAPVMTLALSRDGSRIVYSGRGSTRARGQLFVRELNSLEVKPIPGTEDGDTPVMSPDGNSVMYNSGGRLRRVDLDGGAPFVIADSGYSATSYSWGDNGVVLFYVPPGALYLTSINGATPRLLARADTSRGITTFGFPHLLPGSNAALVTLFKGGIVGFTSAYIGAVRLDDGKVIDLDVQGSNPRYVAGYILFTRANGSILAAPFDARRLRMTGVPVPVLDHVVLRGLGAADYAVADNGTLVYRSGQTIRKLVTTDLQGKATEVLRELREYSAPRFSPDGKRIAVAIFGSERLQDTWIYDTQTGALARLTRDGGDRPEWSADGRTVYTVKPNIVSGNTASGRFMSQPWDASAAPRDFLALRGASIGELSVPRGGRGYLAVRVGVPLRDIWIAPVDSPQALRPYVATPANESEPAVSPDGKWLAYMSDESGRAEVYVRPIPGPGGRLQISTDGGLEPVWSPRGGSLFYRGSGKIMRAHITNLATAPSVTREELFDDVYVTAPVHQMYDVSPDGTKLLFTTPGGGQSKTVVVLNWLTELRQRFSAERR